MRDTDRPTAGNTGGLGFGLGLGWSGNSKNDYRIDETDVVRAKEKAKAKAKARRDQKSAKHSEDALQVDHVEDTIFARRAERATHAKRAEEGGHAQRQRPNRVDVDANAGSDFDAMPDSEGDGDGGGSPADTGDSTESSDGDETFSDDLAVPNNVFRPARILVNPRCVTTYAGVSHTQLALDLFGPEKDEDGPEARAKYVLDDWDGAPESFVCQEQRYVFQCSCVSNSKLSAPCAVDILEVERRRKHSDV